MKHLVEKNLQAVRQQMALACQASGRNVEDIKLLLATKTVPLEKLQIAIQAGEVLFGENKAQELQRISTHGTKQAGGMAFYRTSANK